MFLPGTGRGSWRLWNELGFVGWVSIFVSKNLFGACNMANL